MIVAWFAALACAPFPLGPRESLPEGPRPVARGTVVSEALADEVDTAVQAFLDDAAVPGMSLALVRDGEVWFSAGYGWAELTEPRTFTADTLVLLSSVSKTFVGTAAMQGLEAGRFTLEDPASDYLDFDLDNPKVDGETITLAHLLTHNSGIRDGWSYAGSYVEGDPEVSLADYAEGHLTEGGAYWASGHFARHDPGETFAYSNVGMATAGLAIGNAAGLEFSDLLERDLLDPLGMTRTAYRLADLPEVPAVPYSRAGQDFRPYPQYGYPTYPDGMLRSTAEEMGRYVAMILNDGELEGTRILEAASVDAMLEVDEAYGTDEYGQAVAWARRLPEGRVLYGHNGGDYGSSTEMWLDREANVGIVTLFASNPGFSDWWALQLDLLDRVEAATRD